MKKRGIAIAMFCVSFLALFFTIGNNAQVTEAASFTSKYSISVNEDNVEAKVYVKEGRTYIPIRELTEALEANIAYSRLDELDVYHNYDITGTEENVSIWGNERWGYSIMQRVGENSSPNDVAVYDPPLDCVYETDNCTVIEEEYEGPFILDGRMYIPVRLSAEALDLQLSVADHTIYLNN